MKKKPLHKRINIFLPGVNFLTSGKTELFGDDDPVGLVEGPGEPNPLCVGLEQKGTHRLRFAGRPPNTGSQSKDLFKVAHAIFSLVAN